METILITGVSGFIGQALATKLSESYELIGVDLDKTASKLCNTFYNLNISEHEHIKKIIRTHAPSAIVHAAAIKDLRKCESEKRKAYAVNTKATVDISNIAKKSNSQFIFISSDQVFRGDKGHYLTDSMKDPVNYYGLTKSAAEDKIFENDNVAICRTALVFGEIPACQKGLFKKLRKRGTLGVQGFIVDHVRYRLSHNAIMSLPSDEYCNPTSAELLARQIETVIDKKLHGVFHCCGGERISRYEFGRSIARKFKLDEKLLDQSSSNDPLRPKDVSLDVESTQKAFEFEFPDIDFMLENEVLVL